MANIKNELESVKAFVADSFPVGTKINLENTPAELVSKVAVISLAGERTVTPETAAHDRVDSTIQITYYGTNKLDCLQSMEAVVRKLTNSRVIPLNGSDRHIKFHAPSMTAAYSTQTTGVFVIACMLRIHTRDALAQPNYPMMNHIGANIEGGV